MLNDTRNGQVTWRYSGEKKYLSRNKEAAKLFATFHIYAFVIAMSDLFSFLCLSLAQTPHFALQYIIKHWSNLYSEVILLTCAAQKHSNVKLMIYAFQMLLRSKVWCDVLCIWTGMTKNRYHVIECHHKIECKTNAFWLLILEVFQLFKSIKYSITISLRQTPFLIYKRPLYYI